MSGNGIYVFLTFLFHRKIPDAFNILMSDLETTKIYFFKNYTSPVGLVLGLIKLISRKNITSHCSSQFLL